MENVFFKKQSLHWISLLFLVVFPPTFSPNTQLKKNKKIDNFVLGSSIYKLLILNDSSLSELKRTFTRLFTTIYYSISKETLLCKYLLCSATRKSNLLRNVTDAQLIKKENAVQFSALTLKI